MGSAKTDPLSVEEAKAQLRLATEQLGVRAWVKRRPIEAVTASFLVGMLLASSHPLRSAMMRMFIRVL